MDIQELIERLVQQQPIEYKELPSIPLYMDQITTFLEERMRDGTGAGEERRPTKTMINNYTKAGVLPPPEKKKYSREHVLLLILLCQMKPTLSIADIGKFTAQLRQTAGSAAELRQFYEQFLKLDRECRTSFYAMIEQQYQQIRASLGEQGMEKQAALMYALLLADHAAEEKRLAELILDQERSETDS